MASEKAPPAVSVVMPVKNGARTIEAAISSVLNQTFQSLELIICNDGSTDNTEELIRSFKDERIVLIANDSSQGEGPARDNAISNARGEWLAVIDADDVWMPQRLENLLEATGGEPVLIFDDLMECHDGPTGLVRWRRLRGNGAFGETHGRTIDVEVDSYLRAHRLLIKPLLPKQVVVQHRIEHGRSRFGADTRFFLQVIATGIKLRYLPEPLYLYRLTPGSMTSFSGRDEQMLAILEELRDHFVQQPSAYSAICYKILQVTRSQRYSELLRLLKARDFRRFRKEVIGAEWFWSEFAQRLVEDFRYRVHAFIHDGRRRLKQ